MSATREELEELKQRVVTLEEEQSTVFKKLLSIFLDGEPAMQTTTTTTVPEAVSTTQ